MRVSSDKSINFYAKAYWYFSEFKFINLHSNYVMMSLCQTTYAKHFLYRFNFLLYGSYNFTTDWTVARLFFHAPYFYAIIAEKMTTWGKFSTEMMNWWTDELMNWRQAYNWLQMGCVWGMLRIRHSYEEVHYMLSFHLHLQLFTHVADKKLLNYLELQWKIYV